MADFPEPIDLTKLISKIEKEQQELEFDSSETTMACPSCESEDFTLYWDGTIKCSYCSKELALIVDVNVLEEKEV